MSAFGGLDIIDPDAIARDMTAGDSGKATRETLRRRQAALAGSNDACAWRELDRTGMDDHRQG